MKSLPALLILSILFSSCGVKLPASSYEKTLKEERYLENQKDNYQLHFNKENTDEILLSDDTETFHWDKKQNPVLLKKQTLRPLFLVISRKDTFRVSNRHIDFGEVLNFRDIGGILTTENKTVRWGKIFRSDNLSDLKTSEFDKFSQLGIKTVFDLRTTSEIKNKEDHLPENTGYVHSPTVKDNGDLLTQLRGKVLNGEISDEQSLEMTLDLYRNSVKENLPAVKKLLNDIFSAENAVLYHCSAGKDRTGITTALILSVLKVDRKTIMDEYLLSNYYRKDKLAKMLGRVKLAKLIKWHLNTQAIENFMKVDERYLNATFAEIDKQYGGMEPFIENELGIDETSRKRIIEKFTY